MKPWRKNVDAAEEDKEKFKIPVINPKPDKKSEIEVKVIDQKPDETVLKTEVKDVPVNEKDKKLIVE